MLCPYLRRDLPAYQVGIVDFRSTIWLTLCYLIVPIGKGQVVVQGKPTMQRIVIHNFMALQDVKIDIDHLLILIGEQASGKSTISKLIYFFKSLPQDFIDVVYEDLEREPALADHLWRKIGNKFYSYFGSTRHLEDFRITYFYDENKYLELALKKEKKLDISFQPYDFYRSLLYGQIETRINEIQRYSQQQSAFERKAFQQSLIDFESFTKTIFNEHHTPLFLPAGRNISVNYPEQFRFEFYGNLRSDLARQQLIREESSKSITSSNDLYLMRGFLEHIERIKQRFRSQDFCDLIAEKQVMGIDVNSKVLEMVIDYIEKILRGKYQQDSQGEKLYYDAEKYVYLNNASSGQQEAIRILQDAFLILLDNESAFRVIEEPEAHLYPRAQKYLIEIFAILLNQTDSQFILTTHSPYILSIINNLLYATQVVKTNSQVAIEVDQLIPQISWLEPNHVNAYFLQNGECVSIFDRSTGLIDQNLLDEISEDLGADFQELYQIHAKAFA